MNTKIIHSLKKYTGMKQGIKVKESHIQKGIMDYLKLRGVLCFKHRNVGIFRQDTKKYIPLPFGEKGISDIIGCLPNGRFLAIEVKAPGGKPTFEQKGFIERVSYMGGIGMVAYSIDEVEGRLQNEF